MYNFTLNHGTDRWSLKKKNPSNSSSIAKLTGGGRASPGSFPRPLPGPSWMPADACLWHCWSARLLSALYKISKLSHCVKIRIQEFWLTAISAVSSTTLDFLLLSVITYTNNIRLWHKPKPLLDLLLGSGYEFYSLSFSCTNLKETPVPDDI